VGGGGGGGGECTGESVGQHRKISKRVPREEKNTFREASEKLMQIVSLQDTTPGRSIAYQKEDNNIKHSSSR